MSDAPSEDFARTVVIERALLRNVRNLRPIEIEFSPGLNVFTGDNGQGKTSFLEALTLGLTSRSFRTEQSKDIVAHSEVDAMVELSIRESGLMHSQRVVLVRSRKSTLIDGKRVAKVADFAVRTPVVVFHPADLSLVSGPAALRRTLLARVSLYLDPLTMEMRRTYIQALRERQRLLSDRGVKAPGIEAFEHIASEQGARLTVAHEEAARALLRELEPICESLLPIGIKLAARHNCSGSADKLVFAQRLAECRSIDLIRGRPSFGPQRDDIVLLLGDADARKHGSQGQQRLFALALKLAEFESVRKARHQHPILLLDDVASELDPHRTSAVLDWVSRIRSQVFVTTTRFSAGEERIFPALPRRKFWVHDGVAVQEL